MTYNFQEYVERTKVFHLHLTSQDYHILKSRAINVGYTINNYILDLALS